MLTGQYLKDSRKSYKTVEGKNLLLSVRLFLSELDKVMKLPEGYERGCRIGRLTTQLEMDADAYDLFGEKDRRRKKKGE